MKTATDEELKGRYYILITVVTLLLIVAILVSIAQFGVKATHRHRPVALILTGSKEDHGWNRTQYQGFSTAARELGYDVLLAEKVASGEGQLKSVVEDLVHRGAGMIFLTSTEHLDEAAHFVKNYPDVMFFALEPNRQVYGIHPISVRYYEARYLAGLLAGLRTHTDNVGYVAPFSNPEINRGINAFTLGVRETNPKAEVLIAWTGAWDNPSGEEQATISLKSQGVDVLTYHQNGETVANVSERIGIDFISYHEIYPYYRRYLTGIQIDWLKIYKDAILNQKRNDKNAVGWRGMMDSWVSLAPFSKRVNLRERTYLEVKRYKIMRGEPIFAGEIFDRYGVTRVNKGEALSTRYMQYEMDWLVRGVRTVGN